MGQPSAQWKERVAKRLDARYPVSRRIGQSRPERRALQADVLPELPTASPRRSPCWPRRRLKKSRSNTSCRCEPCKTGWTLEQRKEYFNWFHKAAGYQRRQQLPRLPQEHPQRRDQGAADESKAELKTILGQQPKPSQPKFVFKQRDFRQEVDRGRVGSRWSRKG